MNNLIGLITLVVAIIVMSCSPGATEKDMVGTWKVVNYEIDASVSPLLIASAKKTALQRQYVFNEGGTYQMISEEESTEKPGYWRLSSDLKLLTLSDKPNGEGTTYNIRTLDSEKLIYELDLVEYGTETYTLEKEKL